MFRLELSMPSIVSGTQPPFLPLTVTSNHPITDFDSSKLSLTSAGIAVDLRHEQLNDNYRYPIQWNEEQQYLLTILPGAFTDIFGLTNDTVVQPFKVASMTDYGSLKVEVTGLSAVQKYVLQLVDDKDQPAASVSFRGDFMNTFEHLHPGTYRQIGRAHV